MLFADKRALATNLKVELLEIREKELRFYTSNTLSIGMQSAFFAGFASTALMTHVPKTPVALHAIYLLFTVASLGLQLGVMVSTSLLAMLAPGLALRGPDGSMNVAVDHMISEYRSAFKKLLLGIITLHGSTICFVWLSLATAEACILTLCILSSLWLIIRYIRKLMQRFQLPADEAVTGKFEGTEAQLPGAESGLQDRGEMKTLHHLIKQETFHDDPRQERLAQIRAEAQGRQGRWQGGGGEIVE